MPEGSNGSGVSPAWIIWAARRTVAQHGPQPPDCGNGRCPECKPDESCSQLARARRYLADHEAARSVTA